MITRILIIGGYGNFGRFISKELAQNENIKLIIAGRRIKKAQELVNTLTPVHPAEALYLDINKNLNQVLTTVRPDVVIHTCGPFQGQDYHVATRCIEHGCHYIDLADARDFVTNITCMDQAAKIKGVSITGGASSVPGLTSAVTDYYQKEFKQLEALDYGIATAQRTARGLATTAAILGYTGKAFKTLQNGQWIDTYGWQNLHTHHYAKIGRRWLGNCDVPDLALFPTRYPHLKTIRFYAGLELPVIHFTLWLMSWGVRIGLIRGLHKAAPLLLKTSYLFDRFGSATSAFHMTMSGTAANDEKHQRTFEIIAKSGDGQYIPCIPAILLARRIANNTPPAPGSRPCLGLISLPEYLDALKGFDIYWYEK